MTHTTSLPTSPAAPATLPRIAVLATGGTIAGAAPDATNTAGYQAGALGLASLLDAVPALARVAQIEGEQVASIDSKDPSRRCGPPWYSASRRWPPTRASTAS